MRTSCFFAFQRILGIGQALLSSREAARIRLLAAGANDEDQFTLHGPYLHDWPGQARFKTHLRLHMPWQRPKAERRVLVQPVCLRD